MWGIMKNNLDLNDVKQYLKDQTDKGDSKYRKLLCAYDIMNYKEQ